MVRSFVTFNYITEAVKIQHNRTSKNCRRSKELNRKEKIAESAHIF